MWENDIFNVILNESFLFHMQYHINTQCRKHHYNISLLLSRSHIETLSFKQSVLSYRKIKNNNKLS